MGKAGEPLMLSICAHTILLGWERPTLKVYPCHFEFAQCREIVDAANAMDASVAHVAQLGGGKSVSSRHRIRLTPPTSDAETRPRPKTCARLLRQAKIVTMLLQSPENGFCRSIDQGIPLVMIFVLH